VTSDQYTCDVLGGVMTSGTTWAGILGLMIVVTLMAYKQRSAFIAGIGFITVISWFRNTAISYFPDTPEGDARFDYFTKVVRVEPLDQLVNNFTNEFKGVWGALATFVYIDFLDTSVGLHFMTARPFSLHCIYLILCSFAMFFFQRHRVLCWR
jgi:AGZA family xanthine/uracil permease-like MFS transporter